MNELRLMMYEESYRVLSSASDYINDVITTMEIEKDSELNVNDIPTYPKITYEDLRELSFLLDKIVWNLGVNRVIKEE